MTATDGELRSLSQRLEAIGQETTGVIHVLADQATLINETLIELQAHNLYLEQLSNTTLQVKRQLADIKQGWANLVSLQCRVEEMFSTTDQLLGELAQATDDWAVSLSSLANGKLPPELLPPERLVKILREVSDRLPTGWALTPVLRGAAVWRAYQEAVVATAAYQDGVRLFIHFPIYEFTYAFELYELYPLPTFDKKSRKAHTFNGLPRYLAVSNDRQTFMELGSEDLRGCKGLEDRICPLNKAVHRKRLKRSCAVALFLQQSEAVYRDCNRNVEIWKGAEAVYIGQQLWAYTTDFPQQMVTQCVNKNPPSRIEWLNGTGLVRIPRGCSAHSDKWIFQASLQREIGADEVSHNPWTGQSLPPIGGRSEGFTEASSEPPTPEDPLIGRLQELGRRQENRRQVLNRMGQDVHNLKEMDAKRIRTEATYNESLATSVVACVGLTVCLTAGVWILLDHLRLKRSFRECENHVTHQAVEIRQLTDRMNEHEGALAGDDVIEDEEPQV